MQDLEKRKQIVQQLKPIDDAFAEKLFEDISVRQAGCPLQKVGWFLL